MEEPGGWFPNRKSSEASPFFLCPFPMIQPFLKVSGGYTKITNTILRTIYRTPLNGTEIRIILAIIRLTWGWNKETKVISYSYLAKEANLEKRNVKRTVKLLAEAKVIVKAKAGRSNMLGINRNYIYWELWKTQNAKGQDYHHETG